MNSPENTQGEIKHNPEKPKSIKERNADVLEKIDFLHELLIKPGNEALLMEIYEKINDFVNKLKKTYPEQNINEFQIYHRLIASKKGKKLDDNPPDKILEEFEIFFDDLYEKYQVLKEENKQKGDK